MQTDICLPIRNEAAILETNVLKLLDFLQLSHLDVSWRLVLLVNGSSDQSAEISRGLASRFPGKIASLELEEGGKGRALRTWFASSQADILAFMDADLATSLDCLPRLMKPIVSGRAEAVVGSRLLPGAVVSRRPWRSLVSRVYNFLSRLVIGHRFSDLQCGFKAFQSRAFRHILPFCQDDKWFFDTEWLALLQMFGARIEEIAISWRDDRQSGRPSQIKVIRDVWLFLVQLFRLRRRLKQMRDKQEI